MTGQAGQPIRVCFVILNAYPLFNPEAKGVIGGAEVDSYYLASELAKDPNYNVSCIVADYGQEPVEVRENVIASYAYATADYIMCNDGQVIRYTVEEADADNDVRASLYITGYWRWAP